MKIIINSCYGGFRLSDFALEWLMENKNWKLTEYNKNGRGYKNKSAKIVKSGSSFAKYYAIPNNDELRIDKDVIDCIEKLGDKANSVYSKLQIIEIPDGVEWTIDEYDGIESIHEKHRSWA